MTTQEMQFAIIDLREQVQKLQAEVFHTGDRIHEILRLKKAGRNIEARRKMRGQ